MEFTITTDQTGMRLDRFVRKQLGAVSQGLIERQLRQGKIRLDGVKVKASARLQYGQVLSCPDELHADASSPPSSRSAPLLEQKDAYAMLAGMIIAESDDWLALNKPAGLAVQGGSGTSRHVDGILRAAFPDSPPKLVHRLDRDTSGILVVARHDRAARDIAAGFADKSITKVYLALVKGDPGPQGRIELPLRKAGGRGVEKMIVDHENGLSATTEFMRLDKAGPISLVALRPITGRTHQLRVHMAASGAAIVGDRKYAGAAAHVSGFARQLHLHARFLRLMDGTVLSAELADHVLAGAEQAGLAASLPDAMPWFDFCA